MKNKGCLIFSTLQDLFSTVLKATSKGEFDLNLKDCYILVLSRDILTDTVRTNPSTLTNDFLSRYRNVEFIASLLPTVQQLEIVTTSGMDLFEQEYIARLYGESQMMDIISICEIVANKQVPVIIVSTSLDYRIGFPYTLREFIFTEFGVNGRVVDGGDFDNPEETFNIGDIGKIKEAIEKHKDILLKQTDKEYFFNSIMGDMENAYLEILEEKTLEELRDIAKSNSIFVSRRDDKDRIIHKILDNIKK